MRDMNSQVTIGQDILNRLDRIEKSLYRLEGMLNNGEPQPSPKSAERNEAEPSDANAPMAEQLEIWRDWYNGLWENATDFSGVQSLINDMIGRQLASCVVDFRSDTEFYTSQTYTEVTSNRQGSCFILKVEDGKQGKGIFAAFPYPGNDIWFERGVVLLERLYSILGNSGFLCPRVTVQQVALLEGLQTDSTEDPSPVYRLYKMGVMQVSAM